MILINKFEKIEVHTFIPGSDGKTFAQLEKFFQDYIELENFKRKENYFPPRLVLEDQLALSVVFIDKNIISFSAMSRSPMASNCARVVSRYYTIPEYRVTKKPIKQMNMVVLEQQMDMLDLQYPDIDFAFMSREAPTIRYMKMLEEKWNEHFLYDWTLADNLVQVCLNPGSRSCWQHVLYTAMNGEWPFPLLGNKITEEKWKTLGP